MTDYQRILDDLKDSMLQKNELKTSVLRMLKAELMKLEKEGAGKNIDEEQVLRLIKKGVKQRKDSKEQFEKAGREELANKEEAEIEILREYLPEELSEDNVREVVRKVIAELGATDKSAMGQVMGRLMKEFQGKADGSVVKKVVEEELS